MLQLFSLIDILTTAESECALKVTTSGTGRRLLLLFTSGVSAFNFKWLRSYLGSGVGRVGSSLACYRPTYAVRCEAQ